jgi:hypothetical protein
MHRRIWTRARRRMAAAILATLGVTLWAVATTVYLTPASARDVSIPHITDRLVGVVGGGATLAGAIVLLAAG